MFIKRFFAFVISAFLIFFPVYSYANTSAGGWTALDVITAGATNTINATKSAGGKVLTSAVTVAPSAVKVGKYLIKGGGSAALLIAVPQLIGDGVDWVLDPSNNSISYIDTGSGAGSNVNNGFCTTGKYCAPTGLGVANNHAQAILVSEQCESVSLASTLGPFKNSDGSFGFNYAINCIKDGKTVRYGTYGATAPANYENNQPVPTTKHIPIDTVAAQVISNADTGHAPSQEAVKATALEGFAAGEHDAALDSAATESDAGTENPPDTTDPDAPTDPTKPFDPAGIISAINALKAMLAGILSSITGFFDWAQEAPPEPEQPKDVPFATTSDIGLDSVDRYEQRINFAGQCPSSDFSFQMLGVTYAKPIPYHYLCDFLSQIAPWLLAMCYLGTAYFVVENV